MKTKLLRLTFLHNLALILLFLSSPGFSETEPIEYGFITVPSLRIRSEPDDSWAEVVGNLRFGDIVILNESMNVEDTNWFRIKQYQRPQTLGWVRAVYVGAFNKPHTITSAIQRWEKEMADKIAQKPELLERLKQPTTDSIEKLQWEDAVLALSHEVSSSSVDNLAPLLCQAYKKAETEKLRANVLMITTLLHTSNVFDNDTFIAYVCKNAQRAQIIAKSVNALMANEKEKLLLYSEIWRAFF